MRKNLGLRGFSSSAVLAQRSHARPSQQDQTVAGGQLPAVAVDEAEVKGNDGFCVVNFYHLADLEEPEKVVLAHKARLEGSDVHGRIYISSQGINAQYSGPESQAVEYAQWVRSRPPFQGLTWSTAATTEHAFPRLRVAHRASLVSLAGGTKGLPITDASKRATPLSPAAWKDMLRLACPISPAVQSRAASNGGGDNLTRSSKGSWRSLGDNPRQRPPSPATSDGSHDQAGSVNVETANRVASDSSGCDNRVACSANAIGHHSGNNSDGSCDVSDASGSTQSSISYIERESRPDGVAAVHVDQGSEGDKAVVVLDVRNGYEWDAGHFHGAARPQEATFSETPTDVADDVAPLPLELRDCSGDTPVMMYCTGGIRCDIYSTYLRKRGFTNLYTLEGGVHAYLKEQGGVSWDGSLFVFDDRLAVPAEESSSSPPAEGLPAAVACQLCAGSIATLPHLNCANIDCSRLFVACNHCKRQLNGCCCEACRTEGRLLRPNAGGTTSIFRKASSLFTSEELARLQSGRGEGRLRRRRKREARIRETQRELKDQRDEQRAAIKVAMAARGLAPDAKTQASGRHRWASSEATPETDSVPESALLSSHLGYPDITR